MKSCSVGTVLVDEPCKQQIGNVLWIPFNTYGLFVVMIVSPSKSQPFRVAQLLSQAFKIVTVLIYLNHLFTSSLLATCILTMLLCTVIGALKPATSVTSCACQYFE